MDACINLKGKKSGEEESWDLSKVEMAGFDHNCLKDRHYS